MRVSENSKIRRICISGALFLFYASRFFQCGIIVLDLSAFYEFMCKNPAPKCGIFDYNSFVNETWRRWRDSNSRYPFEVYTISNRARSTSYATSPYCCLFTAEVIIPSFSPKVNRKFQDFRGIFHHSPSPPPGRAAGRPVPAGLPPLQSSLSARRGRAPAG